MTIHPVRMNGLVLGVPQTLSYFDKMQDRIVNFVTSNSNISEQDFRNLMLQTGRTHDGYGNGCRRRTCC